MLTFQLHANTEALLEAAVRAPFPLCLVDLTALVLYACVPLIVLNCSLEETLCGEDDRGRSVSLATLVAH